MDVAALIPAYNPDLRLVGLVQELRRSGRLAEIIVVDDGSGEQCRPLFARLAALPGVTVLRHAVNLGKGAAPKTGLNHFCSAMPQASGVVTADADGQHLPADVLRVAARLEETGDRLVLGSRQFALGVPLRSRLGNVVTKYAFWGVMGKKLEDTQSGLRGVPQALARQLLRLKDSGYEFELLMLVHCRRTGVPIEACPIATVYLDENRSSHFHPIFDSLKIYSVFLRFIAASLATAAVDYLVFFLVFAGMANILLAQGAAAGGGGREFRPRAAGRLPLGADWGWSLAKFVLLVAVMGATSYCFIRTAMHAFGWSVLPAKIASELAVYLANFIIQRDFIFRNAAAARRAQDESDLPQAEESPVSESRRAA